MKFTGFKTSFKGGMVSPRLRGRQKEGEVNSSVEKLENFVIDRVGTAFRRGALQVPYVQPFTNTNDAIIEYDVYPIASTANTVYFAVILKNREFIFRFNTDKYFNDVKNPSSTAGEHDLQSTFLTVIEPDRPFNAGAYGFYARTRVFCPNNSDPYSAYNMDVMTDFTYSLGSGKIPSFLKYYLQQKCIPVQMTKVSDATVVFTCSTGISFSVTIASVPESTQVSNLSEFFLILPYFVNVKALFNNIGKPVVSSTYYNVIRPSNFPFNVLNSNVSYTVTANVMPGQSGSAAADGVLTTQGNVLIYRIGVPKDICIFPDIGVTGNTSALEGKFMILPLATDNSKDVVFFITKYINESPTGTYNFEALRITGGNPTSPTSLWKVSSFGGGSHPKVCDYAFGRLMYANAGTEISKWWASATHPSSLTDFQAFMGFSLGQDSTSDVSKMQYEGITQPYVNSSTYVAATDVYRYGFSSTVPNLSKINFITSRRRIHFGTDDGETQAELSSDSFAKPSYTQLSVRTNSASYGAITKGDGKFFYISNGGKDIRSISTEDKYYESQDELITTALEGLGLIFKKIVWYEKLNSVVALTTDNRVFFITVHGDTQIKAISEFKTSVGTVLDICGTTYNLYFIISNGGYQHVLKYGVNENTSSSGSVESIYIADMVATYPFNFSSDTGWYGIIFSFYKGSVVYALFKGTLYTINIPIDWNGSYSSIVMPFNLSDANYTDRVFFFGSKVLSKLKTLPIDEGGAGGTAVGDAHRIDQLELLVHETGPFKAGTEDGTKYDVEGLSISTLSTKYIKFDFPQTSDDENHFYLETDSPTPLNISGVAYRGKSDPGV